MEENEASVDLFVGQIPKHMNKFELLSFFREFGNVEGITILNKRRDKSGCCFLVCSSMDEAEKIIDKCHKNITLRGASAPLNVRYADRQLQRRANTLFVCKLPISASPEEVCAVFSKYGNIQELDIIRDCYGISRGYGFLKFETKEQATAAKQALDGKYKMKGSKVALVVDWSIREEEINDMMDQRAMSMSHEAPINQNPNSDHHEGPFPMYGYIPPPFNVYGYQTYYGGPVFYPRPPFYSHHALHNMHPRYAVMQGVTPPYLSSAPSSSSVTTSAAGDHMKGPPGANLLVKNIPRGITAQKLTNEFQRFGTVMSVEVLVDETGVDQYYGHVSYYSQVAAYDAVLGMNGFPLGEKRLTVEFQR